MNSTPSPSDPATPEWVWINGEIMPMADARISLEDRGFQFADGVYEVLRLYGGRAFATDDHLDRLERSAGGIDMAVPLPRAELAAHLAKLVERSGVADGMIYLQLTRGACPRNHVIPQICRPTLLFYARPLPPPAPVGGGVGVKLLRVEDERWKRCWVKSIALLPNVLAKSRAVAAGADEAVFVENGVVSECSASNLFAIVGRRLVTHPVGPKVLPGITRLRLLALAGELGLEPVERPMTEAEAESADELFITSTTREVSWVSHWNIRPVSPGHRGEQTARLHAALREQIKRETGK